MATAVAAAAGAHTRRAVARCDVGRGRGGGRGRGRGGRSGRRGRAAPPGGDGGEAGEDRRADARSIALDAVCATLEEGAPLDAALAATQLSELKPQRRKFARKLATETLRKLAAVDRAILRAGVKVPNGGRGRLANIIRLGAVQLLVLDTPEYAAVNETTALATRQGFASSKSLVWKAVKTIAERRSELLASMEADGHEDDLPDWLSTALADAYGEASGELQASLQSAPCLDISVRAGEPVTEWAAKLGGKVLAGNTVRLRAGAGDVRVMPGFEQGAWWVQGAAAASAAPLALVNAPRSVIDLCAAPGGKTMQLACALANTGAGTESDETAVRVTAIDSSARRARLLRRNLERLKIEDRVRVKVCDARALDDEDSVGTADAVLLDAPCSATGTLRRHPNIAYQLQPRDVSRLCALQRELLLAAADMTTPESDAVLLYVTCSILPAECEDQVDWFLSENTGWRRQAITPDEAPLAADEALTAQGDLRFLPQHSAASGGLDGIFVARLVRV